MDLPLCSFDLRTGIFCPQCARKIQQGLYDDLDIKVMRKFLDLEKQYTKLQKAGYVKTVDGGDTVFVVLREGSLRDLSFRELAQIRRKLADEVGKNVRLVEDRSDPIKFVENLAAPARIVAVNKIWLPDGSEETRIIFDYERNLKISREALIRVVEKVKKMKISIDFERRWRRREGWSRRKASKNASIR
ncbi:MAG: hypothetical protein J7J94_03815 [Thaumarchaeota archaeon]|nr:hypothetical protein [Nitrososphaerota archaeon]